VIEIPKGEALSKIDLLQEILPYRRYFLKRINRIILDRDFVEDIFQEACLKFLDSPAIFVHPRAAVKYFFLIVRSLALQHMRVGRWLHFCPNLPVVVHDPRTTWEADILQDCVSQAISSLPEKDQDLLAMLFRPGLTLEQKCQALHLPNSTMRYRAGKAIAKVREMVTTDFGKQNPCFRT
jgi:RNA polymerase sigma factor (sigma-70 family)